MAEQPMNPLAGPAGPGPYSTRTDQLRFQSDYYGQGVENKMLREGAPLAKTPDVRGATATEVRQAATREPITELFTPSQRPDEPITSGIAQGPGPGPEVLGAPQQIESLSSILAQMVQYDTNGEIAALYEQAVARGL
jgi:hypothetical protein